VQAGALLRSATAPTQGTHLNSLIHDVEDVVGEMHGDTSLYYKFFLKYCYMGPKLGNPHEFTYNNTCRQCGFVLSSDPTILQKQPKSELNISEAEIESQYEQLGNHVRLTRMLEQNDALSEMPKWIRAVSNVADKLKNEEMREILAKQLKALKALKSMRRPISDVDRDDLWEILASYHDRLKSEIETRGIGRSKRAAPELRAALDMLDKITEEPFVEGPRILDEYWCAKAMSAGQSFGIATINGSKWFKRIPREHSERLEALMKENSEWFGLKLSDGAKHVLVVMASSLGPVLQQWMHGVRSTTEGGVWTKKEASILLRTIVLQHWRDAITPESEITPEIASEVAGWIRVLMTAHVKHQFLKFSDEHVKQMMQQRAELERTSIVQEFESLTDESRSAMLTMKQLGIGRWNTKSTSRKYDSTLIEFEEAQRQRMGVRDTPFDPVVPAGMEVVEQEREVRDEDFGAEDD